MARRLKKFRDTSTSPEVIDSNTLNFKANFKFSRLIFWGLEDTVPLGVCASKPWSISSACKHLRGQHQWSQREFSPDPPLGVCASKVCSVSCTCKNLRAQHPLRAEILSPKIVVFRHLSQKLETGFPMAKKS